MKFINYATALAIAALCHCWISGVFFPAIDIFFSSYKNKCTFFRSNFCRCWTFYRQPNRSSEFILINHPNCRWHAFWLWCVFFPMHPWCMHVYVVWTFHNNVTNIIDFLSCINLKTLKNMLDSVKLLSAWNEMPSLATFSHGVLRHSGVTTKTLPKCIICMNCRFQWIYLYTFDFLWVIPLENEKRLILVWFSSNDYRCRLGLNQMAFLVYNFV